MPDKSPPWWQRRPEAAVQRRLVVAGVVALLAGFGWLWWEGVPALYRNANVGPAEQLKAITDTRTATLAGLAAIGALGTFWLNSRAQRFTAETLRLTQESQLTDRYAKAIEQLGDDKLDIRLGGLYALERLAVDSERDHPTVVEVLSAFVRRRSALQQRTTTEPLATDIQTALIILGRVPERPNIGRGDLGGAALCGATLPGANLTGATLSRTDLRGANLCRANFSGTDLSRANLSGADLRRAGLAGAILAEADLSGGADLREADLREADLRGAGLAGAELSRARLGKAKLVIATLTEARLTGADLTKADLTRADLRRAVLVIATLTGAVLNRADLSGADLSGAIGLRQEQLDALKGDQDTRLQEGLNRPASWTD
jgi:uncharacterized protein YjbI with pentapeptide repeats